MDQESFPSSLSLSLSLSLASHQEEEEEEEEEEGFGWVGPLNDQSEGRSCMDSYNHHTEPHFLEACFLCRRPLGFNFDIFMYRGHTPFCSKECREEQIEMDEGHEKSLRMSSRSSLRTKDSDTVRTTTLVVA